MEEIKFKYVFKKGDETLNEFHTLDLIEYIASDETSYLEEKGYSLVGRYLFSGLTDIDGIDIYDGDTVYLSGYGMHKVKFPFTQLYEACAEDDIGALKFNQQK